MQRAIMISTPLPKGTKTSQRLKLGDRKSHLTTMGNEICTPAPYQNSFKVNQNFKILTSDLIDLGYVGWKSFLLSFKFILTMQVYDWSIRRRERGIVYQSEFKTIHL